MKRINMKAESRELLKKVEQAVAETIIHKRPFRLEPNSWPFVVFGSREDGLTVIRVGAAEQSNIQRMPVYIATLSGDHMAESEGIPIEELAGGDIPDELLGLQVLNVSPLRPLGLTMKKDGPPRDEALAQVMEYLADDKTAIIETPDEAYWAISVLKYLDECDRFFPDPLLEHFYSRIGNRASFQKNRSDTPYQH